MPPLRALLQPPPTAPASPPRPQGPLSVADRLITLAQGLMGVNQPEPTDFQTPQDFGQADYWHGLGEMLGLVPAIVAPMMAIKAYHGSPHDFSSFDLSKIGTGEGAQAYGHGLYFAEHEGTAKTYRDALSARPNAVAEPVARAQFWAQMMGGRDEAITHLEGILNKQSKNFPNAYDKAELDKTREAVQYLRSGGSLSPEAGKMYEVNIHASPDELLDWDKPLSQQSEKVKQAIKDLPVSGAGEPKITTKRIGPQLHDLYINGEHLGTFPSEKIGEAASKWVDFDPRTGQQILHSLAANQTGGTALGATNPEIQAKAAELLKKAGIKGIQYLDQGSRGAGEGTKNFVIFDDKIIEIAKKYGLALPAAASLYKWQQSQKGVE